jgi:hypothetical protein
MSSFVSLYSKQPMLLPRAKLLSLDAPYSKQDTKAVRDRRARDSKICVRWKHDTMTLVFAVQVCSKQGVSTSRPSTDSMRSKLINI